MFVVHYICSTLHMLHKLKITQEFEVDFLWDRHQTHLRPRRHCRSRDLEPRESFVFLHHSRRPAPSVARIFSRRLRSPSLTFVWSCRPPIAPSNTLSTDPWVPSGFQPPQISRRCGSAPPAFASSSATAATGHWPLGSFSSAVVRCQSPES